MQEQFNLHKSFPEIMRDLAKSKSEIMLSPAEMKCLYEITLATNFLPGALAECGAYQGAASYLLANAMHKSKNLHLFDSFQGTPPSECEEDKSCIEGHDKTSRKYIDSLFREYNKTRPYHVIVHDGWLKDTLCEADVDFSLVFIDVNQYESTKRAIEFFWDRLVKGGWLIIDDYFYERHQGINKAVDELFKTKHRKDGFWRLDKFIILRKYDEGSNNGS